MSRENCPDCDRLRLAELSGECFACSARDYMERQAESSDVARELRYRAELWRAAFWCAVVIGSIISSALAWRAYG